MDGRDRLAVVAPAVELGHAHAAEPEGRDGESLGSQLTFLHEQHPRSASTVGGRMDEPALALSRLTKRYDNGFLALDGLDLEVPDGAFFGLLGPNGAGKTTLISAVCNLIRVSEGEIASSATPHDTKRGAQRDRPGRAGRQPRPLPDRRGDAALPRRLLRHDARRRAPPGARDDGRLRPARQGRRARADAQRRHAPAPAARPRAHARAAPGHPRRADRGRRLRAAPRAVGLHPPPARDGHDDPAHHALPRGGRGAVRGDRADPRRAAARARQRRPTCARRSGADSLADVYVKAMAS